MKFGLVSFLFCATLVSAEYFSKGWEPGQVRKPSSTANYVPHTSSTNQPIASGKHDKSWSLFDFGPLKSLLKSAGINITSDAIVEDELWDSRIPLITDDNFEELIINENLAGEEENTRIWFLVITVSSTQREGISRFVDQQFDEAFNITQSVGDLPNIRWGRIDYMNVTAITTKWAVWSAPFLVILEDRGKSLRFYKAHQLRLNPEILREFLRVGGWKRTQVWSSVFAPGGSGAYLLEWMAIAFSKIYYITSFIPKWLLILVTGSLASVIVNILHGSRLGNQIKASTTRTVKEHEEVIQEEVSGSSGNVSKEDNNKRQRKSARK